VTHESVWELDDNDLIRVGDLNSGPNRNNNGVDVCDCGDLIGVT